MKWVFGVHDPEGWKPPGYEDYLLINELAQEVGRSRDRILQCEKANLIPAPIRLKRGSISYRMYSPELVAEIKEHFSTVKPGPKKGARA